MAPQSEQPRRRASYWQEVLAAFLLALSAVGSTVSVWQASLWSSVQSLALAEASGLRIEATRASQQAHQQMAYDATTFVQFVLAATGRQDEDSFVRALATRFMRPEFRPYVEQWLALKPFENPQAPANPMALPSFKNELLQESLRLGQLAEEKSEEGKRANRIADEFILGSVYFSLVLFFGGICTQFRGRWLITACLVLAVVSQVMGAAHLARLPYQSSRDEHDKD